MTDALLRHMDLLRVQLTQAAWYGPLNAQVAPKHRITPEIRPLFQPVEEKDEPADVEPKAPPLVPVVVERDGMVKMTLKRVT